MAEIPFVTRFGTKKKYRTKPKGKSLTKQDQADDANINVIVKRLSEDGIPPRENPVQPVYGDVADAPDFLTANQLVIEAKAKFEALPAELRNKFENDPAKMLEFCNNPENKDKMIEYGMLPKPEEKVVDPTPEPVDPEPTT